MGFQESLLKNWDRIQTLANFSVLPNPIQKYLPPPNTTSLNIPKTSDILLSEWKTYFSNEFAAPDPTLESKHGSELDKFSSVYPESRSVESLNNILQSLQTESLQKPPIASKLKRKASFGIDNISTFHAIHGTPLLMSHLALLVQIIFGTFILSSSFHIDYLTPIPKKGKSIIHCLTFLAYHNLYYIL